MRLVSRCTLLLVLGCALYVAAQPSPEEKQLFDQMNAARRQAGLPELAWDDRLAQAAREHSRRMVQSKQLAHVLPGEPTVAKRLAATGAHFNRSGENVGYNSDFNDLHPAWMNSPPHRENILHPDYTLAGIGVVKADDGIWWATTDFAHVLPMRTANQAEDLAAHSFIGLRQKFRRPPLERIDNSSLHELACEMAKTGKLDPAAALRAPGVRNAVAYNNSRPEQLPASAREVANGTGYRQFAVGACFTEEQPRNPGGTYYVIMTFY
jgi:hypothetical protein